MRGRIAGAPIRRQGRGAAPRWARGRGRADVPAEGLRLQGCGAKVVSVRVRAIHNEERSDASV